MTAAKLALPSHTCIHFAESAPAQAELAGQGLYVADIGGGAVHTDEELFEALARALRLPDSFEGSWEALDESLRALEWLAGESGCVLIIRNSEHTWKGHQRMAGRLHASWSQAGEEWVRREKPFHLVFEW
ncbi:MAG: barstar family protein [Solirubrobacterales bacterium]